VANIKTAIEAFCKAKKDRRPQSEEALISKEEALIFEEALISEIKKACPGLFKNFRNAISNFLKDPTEEAKNALKETVFATDNQIAEACIAVTGEHEKKLH
jgi:hypothetical protein